MRARFCGLPHQQPRFRVVAAEEDHANVGVLEPAHQRGQIALARRDREVEGGGDALVLEAGGDHVDQSLAEGASVVDEGNLLPEKASRR